MSALGHDRKSKWEWAPAIAVVLAVLLVAPAALGIGCGPAEQASTVTTIAMGVDSRQVGAATATTAAGASTAPVVGEGALGSAGSQASPADQSGVEPIANLVSAEANLDRKVMQNAALHDRGQARLVPAAVRRGPGAGRHRTAATSSRRRRRPRPTRPSCGGVPSLSAFPRSRSTRLSRRPRRSGWSRRGRSIPKTSPRSTSI